MHLAANDKILGLKTDLIREFMSYNYKSTSRTFSRHKTNEQLNDLIKHLVLSLTRPSLRLTYSNIDLCVVAKWFQRWPELPPVLIQIKKERNLNEIWFLRP